MLLIAIGFFYTFLIFAVAKRFVNVSVLMKTYKMLVIFACFYLFAQVISFYGFSVRIPDNIPFIAFIEGTHNISKWIFRPASVFSEPAKFVHYVSPYLVLELFKKQGKINFKIAVIISLALLLYTFMIKILFLLGLLVKLLMLEKILMNLEICVY